MLERSAASHCLYCGGGDLCSGVSGVEDLFFRNVPDTFEFRRCAQCGSLVLADPLAGDILHEAYREYYTHSGAGDVRRATGAKQILRERYLQRRFAGRRDPVTRAMAWLYAHLARDFDTIERAGRHAQRAPGRVLDYGCGNGEFLMRMRGFGYDVVGMDFDPVCIERANASGLTVHSPDAVPDRDWQGVFDFISLAHVIEHVPEPRDVLRQLSGWLKPGGTLFLETPNAESAGLSVFGKYWRGLEAPRHLSVPSATGLLEVASSCGLTLERQIVSPSLRRHLWEECMSAVPPEERGVYGERMDKAPELSPGNAEFLTYLFVKQT